MNTAHVCVGIIRVSHTKYVEVDDEACWVKVMLDTSAMVGGQTKPTVVLMFAHILLVPRRAR